MQAANAISHLFVNPYLVKLGAHVTTGADQHVSAITAAAKVDHTTILEFLLNQSASVLLYLACQHNHQYIVGLLLTQ